MRYRGRVDQRFANRFAVQVRDLIRADHHGLRMQGCHGARLGHRQAARQRARRLAGERCLVDLRGNHSECKSQSLQQFASVG